MTSLRAGDKLDHYLIENLVARSGMASIFRATDTRTNQPVAIKIPHPEMEADPVLYERFIREAEIGQMLDHPAIMKVYQVPVPGRLYTVMEWVEGKPLRKVMGVQRKLPPERAIGIVFRVLQALDHMHNRGVAHRDLKPENIMVNGDDNVKLIDFGIASKAGARRLTFGKLSQVMGTPDYMSPEQVKGKRGDRRSDLYSLGVMLYEMLAGKVPFTGPSPFVIMNDRLLNNPIPPREIDPGITPQLQEIIYRAMERDPNKRYPNAHEFIWDLEHQDQVGVADRSELRDWKIRREPWARRILFYVMLALIPVVIFGLLLYVARHC